MSDGFLSRWARRKRDVRRSERAVAPAEQELVPQAGDAVEAATATADTALAPEAEADLLADLPSLADLTAETDLIPFLRAGVPSAMRNAALRRMWSVDPAIRDFVSEAREYAYDWNTPGGVPGLGPLLQSDDVTAMLGRLFNREPDAANPSDTATPAMDAPEQAPPVVPDRRLEASNTLDLSDSVPDPEVPAEASGFPQPPSAMAVSTIATPRLRRHGGATPT